LAVGELGASAGKTSGDGAAAVSDKKRSVAEASASSTSGLLLVERVDEVRGGMPTEMGCGATVVACRLPSGGSLVGDVGEVEGSDDVSRAGGALASPASPCARGEVAAGGTESVGCKGGAGGTAARSVLNKGDEGGGTTNMCTTPKSRASQRDKPWGSSRL